MRSPLAKTRLIGGLFLLALGAPGTARAQAWLAPKGEASFSLAYRYVYAGYHTTASGDNLDLGKMRWNFLTTDLDYAATDRLTFQVGIPYVISRYSGAFPHATSVDNGNWNGTFADFQLEARYMAKAKGLVITPFLAVGLPSHQYETFAHSAAGKGLKEVSFGFGAGRLLDPVLSDAYAQTRISYTIPERVLGISHERLDVAFETGYLVTGALTVDAFFTWQRAFGGWTSDDFPAPDAPNFIYHDQLAHESFFDVGIGASYAVLPNVDVFVNGSTTARSENATKASGVTVGVRIGFSPARILRRVRERRGSSPSGTE